MKTRKSAASRADRPANSLPLFGLSERSARVARLSGWTLFHTVAVGGLAGGLWWCHINVVPNIVVPEAETISPNGYPALIAATAYLRRDKEVGDAMTPMKSLPTDPKRKMYTLAEKEALIAENGKALQAMRDALALPAQVPPIRSWDTLFPELAKFRQTARVLALEGQVYAARGQYDKAANSYLTAMELGERIGHRGVLINKLVAIACEAIGRRGLLLMSDKLSPKDARSVIARLEGIQSRRAGMDESLTEEKWITQAEYARLFRTQNLWQMTGSMAMDSGGPDEDSQPSKPSLGLRIQLAALLMRYSKTQIADAHRQYMDVIIANAKLPYDRSRPTPPLPPDYLNQILLPVFEQAHHKEADTRAQNALLITKLALQAYQDEKSQLPANLDALVTGGYLRAVPVDPFAKNGKETLRYQIVRPNARPAALLYSVGPDGADNNGTPIPPSETNKNKRWTEAQDNGDFVLGVNYF